MRSVHLRILEHAYFKMIIPTIQRVAESHLRTGLRRASIVPFGRNLESSNGSWGKWTDVAFLSIHSSILFDYFWCGHVHSVLDH